MEDGRMRKTTYLSLLTVFLLVLSVFATVVHADEETNTTEDVDEADALDASETEDAQADAAATEESADEEDTDESDVDESDALDASETEDAQADAAEAEEADVDEVDTDDLTESEVEELGLEDVTDAEADVTDAEQETLYNRAFYFITEKILTAEAVISYLNENYPDVDTSSLEEYKAQLEEIRDGLSQESDFEAVHEQVVALIKDAKAAADAIFEENDISKEDVMQAIQEYKQESTEDDDAKEAWGEARSGYVHAKETVVLARMHNFQKVAEHYGQDVEDLDAQIAELQSLADQISAAAGNFDKEQIDALVDKAKDVAHDAKELAKNIRTDVKEAHKEQRDAEKEERKQEHQEEKDARDVVDTAKQEVQEAKDAVHDARVEVKEARQVHGSARWSAAIDEEDEQNQNDESEADDDESNNESNDEDNDKESGDDDGSDEEIQ